MTIYMTPNEAAFLKQAIKDQIAPLLERIEKLEAERKEPAAPPHTRPHRESPKG